MRSDTHTNDGLHHRTALLTVRGSSSSGDDGYLDDCWRHCWCESSDLILLLRVAQTNRAAGLEQQKCPHKGEAAADEKEVRAAFN